MMLRRFSPQRGPVPPPSPAATPPPTSLSLLGEEMYRPQTHSLRSFEGEEMGGRVSPPSGGSTAEGGEGGELFRLGTRSLSLLGEETWRFAHEST